MKMKIVAQIQIECTKFPIDQYSYTYQGKDQSKISRIASSKYK